MPKLNSPKDIFKLIDMSGGPEACWPWKGATGGRSSNPRPYYTTGGKRYIAYRLVYELVHGVTLNSDQLLLHSCDNGAMPIGCCNYNHLSIGDNTKNMEDMKTRERHGLPHHVVKAIRRLLEQGRTQQVIADLYGISRENVSAIANGRTYGHVTGTDEATKTDTSK